MRGIASLILGIFAIISVALLQGVAIGVGEYTIALIAINAIAITIFTLVRPEFGIFFYLIIMHFERFLPLEYQPSRYVEGIGFGLNVSNLILLLVFGSWIVRLVLTRDRADLWLPSGRFGKLVVLYLAMVTFATANVLVAKMVLRVPYMWEGPTFFIALWRNAVLVPLLAIVIMQSKLSPRFVNRLAMLYIIAMVALGVWSVVTLVQAFVSGAIYHEIAAILRGAPIDLAMTSLAFVGVCVAMIILSRGSITRFLWLIPLVAILAAIAYMQRRATYIGVVLEFLVVLYIIGRRDHRYRPAVNAALVVGAIAAAIATPIVVIDRLAYTVQVVGGEYTLEGSAAIRLKLWGLVFSGMIERWWSILWGNGWAFASTAFTRARGVGGLSVHNLWLESFVDVGLVGVFLIASVYVEIFRIHYALALHSHRRLLVSFSISIASLVIAVQIWLLAHSSGLGGQYGTLLFIWTAAYIPLMRPGGPLARMYLPLHKCTGMEYLRYDPRDYPEDETDQKSLSGSNLRYRSVKSRYRETELV